MPGEGEATAKPRWSEPSARWNLLATEWATFGRLGFDVVGSAVDLVGSGFEVVGSAVDLVGSGFEVVGSAVDLVGSGFEVVGSADPRVGATEPDSVGCSGRSLALRLRVGVALVISLRSGGSPSPQPARTSAETTRVITVRCMTAA